MITFARHEARMCSRVGASIARATGYGDQMIVTSGEQYERRAVELASSIALSPATDGHDEAPIGTGELYQLRKALYLSRSTSPLFDTRAWVRDLERGYEEAWRRWVVGTEFEDSPEWHASDGAEKKSGCIWLSDLK